MRRVFLLCPAMSILLASAMIGWTSVMIPARAAAQDLALASRAPRFLMAAKPAPVEVDIQQSALLRRVVSLTIAHPTVGRLLAEIERQTGVRFGYSEDRLSAERPIALHADTITVGAALVAILMDTGLDVLLSHGRQVVLVERRKVHAPVARGALVGRVTDSKAGTALAGADIILDGTSWRTTTDTGGRYRLSGVEAGSYTLLVRRIGYARSTRAVKIEEGEDTVNVALEPLVRRLDELVSTATGQRRRFQVPTDMTVLNADSLVRTQPIRSVTDILEGRVPGLTVQRTSGAPGDPSRLRLRGAASPLLNNDPIVVVDGVRVYAQQSAQRSGNLADPNNWQSANNTNGYAAPSPLDYIDPNSIETIEVVKGAAATTLYGQDAANGVIVITTKKGKAGPTRWTLSAEHGITDEVAHYPERVLRWGHNEWNYPLLCPLWDPLGAAVVATNICSAPDSIVRFQILNDPTLTPLSRGQRTQGSLTVAGGVRSLTYSFTGTYGNELGVLRMPSYEVDRFQTQFGQRMPNWMRRPHDYTQWGITSQLRAELGASADLTFTAALSQNDQQRTSLERDVADFSTLYYDRANGRYYQTDGLSFRTDIGLNETGLSNYYTKVTDAATDLRTGVALTWRPRSWLTTTVNAGVDVIQRLDEMWLPRGLISSPFAVVGGPDDSTGTFSDGRGRTIEQTLALQGTALRPLGRGFTLHFTTRADYTGRSERDAVVATRALPPGQEVPGDTLVGHVQQNVANLATFGLALEAALERGSFSFPIGLRFDGGSSYGQGVTLPTFPKLGGSWLMSDEPFFPFKSLFQSFRVRAAYGRASRQPGPTDRLRLYTARFYTTVDQQSVLAAGLATLGNTQLRPERTSEFEGGVDADLLDSRLSVRVTGYRKTTHDALVNTPLPPSVGALQVGGTTSILRNIGVTRNTGLDVELDAQLVRGGPVLWSTHAALSHRRDEVVRLGQGVSPFSIGGDGSGSQQLVTPGYPLFGYWAKPVVGYSDANGDGIITPGEVVVGDTVIYRGAPLPDYTATFSSSIGLWHGAVQLTADVLHDHGMTQHLSGPLIDRAVGLSAGLYDPAASLAEQALVASTAVTPYFWYQRVSTTRLNAVAVNYMVPAALARRLGAQQLSIALQGSNLAVWSNYRGPDPNVNGAPTGNAVVDAGQLPQSRTWQLRIHATY